MAQSSPKRLRRLLDVHGKLSAAHEAKRASFLTAASAARAEADNLRERFDAAGSLFALFPELYHERVARALDRASNETAKAEAEAMMLAKLSGRAKIVRERLREAEQWAQRAADEHALLEWVETRLGQPPASMGGDSPLEA